MEVVTRERHRPDNGTLHLNFRRVTRGVWSVLGRVNLRVTCRLQRTVLPAHSPVAQSLRSDMAQLRLTCEPAADPRGVRFEDSGRAGGPVRRSQDAPGLHSIRPARPCQPTEDAACDQQNREREDGFSSAFASRDVKSSRRISPNATYEAIRDG